MTTYELAAVLGGSGSAHPFRRSLSGIAVGSSDTIYALGDEDIRVFSAKGDLIRRWAAPKDAVCLAVRHSVRLKPDTTREKPDTTRQQAELYIGSLGRVRAYDADGKNTGTFSAGEIGGPAEITAMKIFRDEILIADAAARVIRRYAANGSHLGNIGDSEKTRRFMLPNRSLDFDVDANGVIRAADAGRHRVSSWKLDGTFVGAFGAFGHARPEDFVGCCNPINLAVAPDGAIVTGEKMVARVKVYDANGRLRSVIGTEHFDQGVTHLPLAVDSKHRIVVADPERREIRIFALARPGGPHD